MHTETFTVAYDVLRDGLVGSLWKIPAAYLLLLAFLTFCLIRGQFRRQPILRLMQTAWILLLLALWSTLGGAYCATSLYENLSELRWARSGACAVVSGVLKDRYPVRQVSGTHRGPPHIVFVFTVDGVRFVRPDIDIWGVRNGCTPRHVDFRDGMYVRITHHDGTILKVEIRR